MKRILPGVVIDGVTFHPPGWMWILAFAINGCEWALRDVEDPAFDLRGRIQEYFRQRRVDGAEREIKRLEQRLSAVRLELSGLKQAEKARTP